MLVAQIAIVASGPATAATCAPFELTVAARAPGTVAPRIALPGNSSLQVLRASVASRVGHDGGGAPSAISEGTFVVVTSASGRVTLPDFVASVGGESARAAASPVEVRRIDDGLPRVLVRAHLEPDRDSVYVGEQLDYVVDVQLNDAARQRLRRNPTLFPPDMPAVLAYDLPSPPPVRRTGPHCFETLTYRRALFPLFAGATSLPPAALSYALPVSTSFFSREESFEVRTDRVQFVATEPPAAGRPVHYIGAVGAVRATARLGAPNGRMGDPIVLTLRLQAVGNVKLMPRPLITLPWASIALGDERVTVDSSASHVSGAKEFDWLLTPLSAGQLVVPPILYPFFDPARASYDVAVTDSLGLDVAAASLATVDTASAGRLSIRTVLREETGGTLPTRLWFWALLALAPAPAALRRLRVGRRRGAAHHSAMRRLKALASARGAPDARASRRAFLDALGERVPALVAAPLRMPLARTLRRSGVTDATADAAESLLEQLDAAAFSAAGSVSAALVARAMAVASAVNAEAVRTNRGVNVACMLLVVALGAGALQLAAMQPGVTRAFAEGVSSYQRGDYVTAQRLFSRVGARAPRAADGWANLGTAAWARGDTAHASLGWQRALRLDPLDAESRERLAVVQPLSVGSPAYVPPVPVNAAALAALALWIGAWLALAIPASRRPPLMRATAGGAIALAVVTLGTSLELESRSGVRALGVVRDARSLLDTPSGSAPPVAAVSAGEMGALGAREGAWVRITLDGTRAGWLPAAALLRLDDPVN